MTNSTARPQKSAKTSETAIHTKIKMAKMVYETMEDETMADETMVDAEESGERESLLDCEEKTPRFISESHARQRLLCLGLVVLLVTTIAFQVGIGTTGSRGGVQSLKRPVAENAVESSPSLEETSTTMAICAEDGLYLNETRLQSWKKAGVPILSTAMQNPDTLETYLLFRYPLRKYFRQDKAIDLKYDFVDAHWSCNGLEATEPYPVPTDMSSQLINLFLIKCPPLPDAGSLTNVTVQTKEGQVFHYQDLKDFFHCQVHGHPASRILQQPNKLVLSMTSASGCEIQQQDTRAPLLPHVVLATMIRGSSPQAYLPQWIEYHRHVYGIRHFFVYVNEPWETYRGRPSYQEWDFVTYVPFPLGFYHDDEFYYQRLQQNDIFWRIKQLALSPSSLFRFGSQIKWIGMIDIDEYLDVPALDASENSGAYRNHLENLLEKYSNANDSDRRASISFHNTFFGGPNANNFEWTNEDGTARDILLCRFDHRREPLVETKLWQRQKFFAHVDTAVYMNVHLVISLAGENSEQRYDSSPIWMDPETELQHNHFKLSYEEEANILDERWRNTFCDMMHEVLD